MKSLGGDGQPIQYGVVRAEEALRYAMCLPVATTICGMDSLDVLRQNAGIARADSNRCHLKRCMCSVSDASLLRVMATSSCSKRPKNTTVELGESRMVIRRRNNSRSAFSRVFGPSRSRRSLRPCKFRNHTLPWCARVSVDRTNVIGKTLARLANVEH
jgi:hypothetical protein